MRESFLIGIVSGLDLVGGACNEQRRTGYVGGIIIAVGGKKRGVEKALEAVKTNEKSGGNSHDRVDGLFSYAHESRRILIAVGVRKDVQEAITNGGERRYETASI